VSVTHRRDLSPTEVRRKHVRRLALRLTTARGKAFTSAELDQQIDAFVAALFRKRTLATATDAELEQAAQRLEALIAKAEHIGE
jgi:hypothetical protein